MTQSVNEHLRDGASPGVLIALSGLPGVGKTTLARRLAELIPGAVHIRIDTIEAALNQAGIVDRAGGWDAFPDVGYQIAWAMTRDHLRTGHSVVGDSVNPIAMTREGWASCARDTGSPLLNIEVACTDANQHRRRVEERDSNLPGLTVPTWEQVEQRVYEPWSDAVTLVDSANGVGNPAEEIARRIKALRR